MHVSKAVNMETTKKKVKAGETYENPEKLTKENVIYWSTHYKEVKGAPKGQARAFKAHKFIKLGLIKWDTETKAFYCSPIKGYNKTTYTINSVGKEFKCNCQFNCQTGKICSHILAVYLWLKIHNYSQEIDDRRKV